jgi:hypothetical protein
MRVLVCGGRNYSNYLFLSSVLNTLHNDKRINYIIHGAASGADSLADQWAAEHHIPVRVFPADWGKHGRAAGPIRNKQMLDEGKPDVVIAFPGNKGTRNMIAQATQHPSKPHIIDFQDLDNFT